MHRRSGSGIVSRHHARHTLLALSSAALIALGVGACGGSSASHSGQAKASSTPTTQSHPASAAGGAQVIRTAYTTSLGHKTATFTLTEQAHAQSQSGSTEAATITGHGQGDFANHDFTVTINAPSGGSVEARQLGAMQYIQVPPAQRAQIPGHKPWAAINLNQVAEAKLGKSFSQIAATQNDDPSKILSKLAGVSDQVTRAGTTTIAGTPVTEYKIQVDLNKLAARQQAKAGAKAAQAIRQQEQALGTHTLPVTVWIGADHLVRRIQQQIPIPAASNGKGIATLTMNFTNYGTPAHLAAPPSNQVANITQLVIQHSKVASS